MNEQSLLLHTENVARSLQHRVQRIHHSLEELERLTRFAFRAEPPPVDTLREWVRQENFGFDSDGYYLPLDLLADFRAGAAPPEAVSTFWHIDNIDDMDACARLYALRHFGPELVKIRARHQGVAWIYYQDAANVSIQFPYIDMKTAVPPDFDWRTYHTYVSVSPPNCPDRSIKWTPPTIDYANQGLITSASIPLCMDDQFVGLWSIDVPITPLFEEFAGSKVMPEQSNLIMAGGGEVLLHGSLSGKDAEEKGSVHRTMISELELPFSKLDPAALFRSGSGRMEVKHEGESWIILYAVIHHVNWIYVASCPQSALLDAAKDTMRHALSKIGSGDLTYRITGPLSSEMKTVADACNAMADSLETARREQKRAEEAQLQTEELLRREKELLAVIFNSINQAIVSVNSEGNVHYINREAECFFGVESASFNGRPVQELFSELEGEWGIDATRHTLACMEKQAEIRVEESPIEVVIDDERRYLTARFTPILRERATLGAVIVLNDVTETYLLTEERRRRNKLDSIGVLAGGIAHDFNNILTSVIGNVSLLTMKPPLPVKEQETILSEVLAAGQRARELSHQMLTFSKGGSPIRKDVYIGPMLAETSTFALRGSPVRCVLEIAEDLFPVHADLTQISQVVNNLVINAQQAMPMGGSVTVRALNLEARKEYPDGAVQIEVMDEGVGIPAELRERIFDPYFTTKQTGSGLGLAVAYAVITKHNGKLELFPGRDRGTVFRITLPAVPGSVPMQAKPPEPRSIEAKEILLIEDEAAILRLLTRMLEKMGHTVTGASTGEEAIARCRARAGRTPPFDIVIADLTIPGGIGGAEAVSILRQYRGMKYIVSSGYSEAPVMAEFKNHGFDAVLPKPYTRSEIGEVLASLFSE